MQETTPSHLTTRSHARRRHPPTQQREPHGGACHSPSRSSLNGATAQWLLSLLRLLAMVDPDCPHASPALRAQRDTPTWPPRQSPTPVRPRQPHASEIRLLRMVHTLPTNRYLLISISASTLHRYFPATLSKTRLILPRQRAIALWSAGLDIHQPASAPITSHWNFRDFPTKMLLLA